MKLCTFCYVPPPTVGHPEAFLKHLARYRCTTDAIIFSEYPWNGVLRLKQGPEQLKDATFPNGELNKFAIPNVTFLTGVRLSLDRGYTHAIVLEPDCRVGRDDWDQVMWEEFFNLGKPAIAAGSLGVYNPCNHSPECERKWNALIRRNTRKNFPVTTYGYKGAGQDGGTCIFPNGALAIYDLAWLAKLWDLSNTVMLAKQITAWDMAFGFEVFKLFGVESFDHVLFMESIWSGYGNLVTTEEQRIGMLARGEVVAIHQIKTDWAP